MIMMWYAAEACKLEENTCKVSQGGGLYPARLELGEAIYVLGVNK